MDEQNLSYGWAKSAQIGQILVLRPIANHKQEFTTPIPPCASHLVLKSCQIEKKSNVAFFKYFEKR